MADLRHAVITAKMTIVITRRIYMILFVLFYYNMSSMPQVFEQSMFLFFGEITLLWGVLFNLEKHSFLRTAAEKEKLYFLKKVVKWLFCLPR